MEVTSGLTLVASGFCDRLIIKTHCQQSNLRNERSLLNTIFLD
ncbi:hypothetical protein [Nostoc sp. NMS8]|nr:hypothetical protein [Nostoc sp. NMS8]